MKETSDQRQETKNLTQDFSKRDDNGSRFKMSRISLTILILFAIFALNSLAYDNISIKDKTCQNKDKLHYHWVNNKCEAYLQISDKVTLSYDNGIYLIKSFENSKEQPSEIVAATWMNNDRKNDNYPYIKICTIVNPGCFVRDPAKKGTSKLSLTGSQMSLDPKANYFTRLEAYEGSVSDDTRINIMFQEYRCDDEVAPRLTILKNSTKEKMSVNSLTFAIEEPVNDQKSCEALNNKNSNRTPKTSPNTTSNSVEKIRPMLPKNKASK